MEWVRGGGGWGRGGWLAGLVQRVLGWVACKLLPPLRLWGPFL